MDGETRREEFVRESFERWTPRYLNAGLNYSDVRRLEARIDSWDEWCSEFGAVGETHADLGESALERGDRESAGRHFVQASLYYHFGSHAWHEDDAVRERAHRTSVDLFERGGELLSPPVQRIEAPYPDGGFDVPGNLRVADGRDEGPLVVLLPGLESSKEELFTYEPALIERGLSTLAVDGAGQGETWYNQAMTPDYPDLISAVIDYVEGFDGFDPTAIGVLGQSLGGFYAPYTAAAEPRIGACAGISGPFTVGPVSNWQSDLSKEHFLHACKTDSLAEADDVTERLTLRGSIEDVETPILAITGGADTTVAPAQTQRIADKAPNGEFVCYEGANHICNDVPYRCVPFVSDWLRRELI